MRKFTPATFFLIGTLFCLPVLAQQKQPGHIITNKGDTLHGFIAYRDSRLNPRYIYFHDSRNATQPQKITPADVLGFAVDGEKPYTSFNGTINTDPVELSKLLYNTDRHFNDIHQTKDSVFLRRLVSGEVSLYELQDFKFHYFIQYKDGQIEELLNKFYMVKGTSDYKANNRIYIHQLDSFFTAHSITVASDDLQAVNYFEEDLVRMLKRLDKSGSNHPVVSKVFVSKKRQGRFGIGAGIIATHFRLNDAPYSIITDNTVNPTVNIYYDFTGIATLNSFFGRLALKAERFSYHINQQQKEKTGQNTQTLTNLVFIPSLNYTFLKQKNFAFYIGAAPSVNINLANEGSAWTFTYTQFYPNGTAAGSYSSTEIHRLKRIWANMHAHAGVFIHKNYDFQFGYDFFNTPEESVSSGYSDGFKLHTLSLSLHYSFITK